MLILYGLACVVEEKYFEIIIYDLCSVVSSNYTLMVDGVFLVWVGESKICIIKSQ